MSSSCCGGSSYSSSCGLDVVWDKHLHSLSPYQVPASCLGLPSLKLILELALQPPAPKGFLNSWKSPKTNLTWDSQGNRLDPTYSNQEQGELSTVPSPVEQLLQRATELHSHHFFFLFWVLHEEWQETVFSLRRSLRVLTLRPIGKKKLTDFCSILRESTEPTQASPLNILYPDWQFAFCLESCNQGCSC